MRNITGGAGFVGTRLCQVYKDAGEAFRILDIRPSQRFSEEVVTCDIRDPAALDAHLTGNLIVHLAAVHRDDIRPLSLYGETNVDGTRNVCDAATAKGIKRIIFASTVAVYGFAEKDSGEDAPIQPFNEYGKTKYEAETVLCDWAAEDPERSVVIIRPTVIFGEGNRGNVFNLLSSIATGRFLMIGPGTNRKSMAYVGNIAAFLRHVEDYMKPGVHVVNYIDKPDFDMNALVGHTRSVLTGKTGVGLRFPLFAGSLIGTVADVVARITGKTLPISAIRVKKFTSSTAFSTRAHEAFDFAAPFTLAEGLERTLRYEFLDDVVNRETYETE